jgi:NADPH:quinone reductase-like Zn-dependent oxidoreductase
VSDLQHLTAKPRALDWIRAGAFVGDRVTSLSAVHAVALQPGEVVAVSAAAGGVGGLAAQLARRAGARVLGIASAASAGRLRAIGVEPVAYGDGLADRLRSLAPDGIDAFIDTQGDGYVDLAVALGVTPGRIDTIIDFAGAQRHGTKTDASPQASTPDVLATMAEHVAWGRLTVPVAAIYPLEQVQDAYTELASGHVYGKSCFPPKWRPTPHPSAADRPVLHVGEQRGRHPCLFTLAALGRGDRSGRSVSEGAATRTPRLRPTRSGIEKRHGVAGPSLWVEGPV